MHFEQFISSTRQDLQEHLDFLQVGRQDDGNDIYDN